MTEIQFQQAQRLYNRLLKLYPASFRQEFGEEMRFVFAELLRDTAARDGAHGVALLWGRTLLDLGKSLVHAHWELWKGSWHMTLQRVGSLGFAMLTGLLLVLPLIVLEAISTSGFARANFPLVLYATLWILAALFVFILAPMVRSLRTGSLVIANRLVVALKVAALAFLAWAWVGLVLDQMPCFLGASGC